MHSNLNLKKHQTLIWITIFAITMGIFEGSVVVYIRALYYPQGFDFPLVPIDTHIAITELIRELASLFMLLSVGIIAGKNFSERFSWFIYSFAVWDIFYYVFLWLILSWPESILTWDILFLLPITWTGPVIAPIIISILMIVLAMAIYVFNKRTNYQVIIIRKEWIFLIVGSIGVFTSFIWDYSRFLIKNISLSELKERTFTDKLFDLSVKYIPESFNWFMFLIGCIIITNGIVLFIIRNKKILYLDKK